MIDRCGRGRERDAASGKRLVEEDDTAIEMAQQWLDKHAPSAQLGEIDDTAFKVAAKLYDFGVSTATATEMLCEWSDTRAFPPMQLDRIKVVAESAGRNRGSAVGKLHPNASGFEAVEIDESKNPFKKLANTSNTPETPRGGLARPLRRFDPANIPPVPWIIPGLAARRMVSALVGPGGVSKSTWTLHLAVAGATGRGDICGFPVRERQRVWVYSQEDTIEVMEARLAAVMQVFGVSHDDMEDDRGQPMMYLNSGVGRGNRLELVTRERDVVKVGKDLGRAVESGKEIGASLIILDPLISFHDSPENENTQMRKVMEYISDIAFDADCAVELIAHTGKPDKASSKGLAGNQYAARGATAIIDAVRAAATLVSMSEDDRKTWIIPTGESHLDYVRIDDAKMNIGKMGRKPRWFKREDVVVHGFRGDSMQVLRPIELQSKEAEGAPDTLTPFARVMMETGQINQPVPLADLIGQVPQLSADDKKKLTDRMGRKRRLDEAFGKGVMDAMTDYGKLVRSTGTGKVGTLFTLIGTPASKSDEAPAVCVTPDLASHASHDTQCYAAK